MASELPRCVRCRVNIQPGQGVVFRPDGRVEHGTCPEVSCPVCSRAIYPATPIRREGEHMLHANCWVKQYRASARAS